MFEGTPNFSLSLRKVGLIPSKVGFRLKGNLVNELGLGRKFIGLHGLKSNLD